MTPQREHRTAGPSRSVASCSSCRARRSAAATSASTPTSCSGVAAEIAVAVRAGVQVAIVVGGGNFFRGAELSQRGLDRARADYMGMLGTVMNCLALQDFLEQAGVSTRVQTAITMGQVAEPYIPLRAIRHLEKGRVVIFGAGAGMPYFSTDTVSVQRALETHCRRGAHGQERRGRRLHGRPPDGPRRAVKLDHLTYDRRAGQRPAASWTVGAQPVQGQRVRMRVFGLEGVGNVTRALQGEKIGTLSSRRADRTAARSGCARHDTHEGDSGDRRDPLRG